MTNISQFKNIPELSFIDVEVQNLIDSLISEYEENYLKITGVSKKIYPNDEMRILLHTAALKFYHLLTLIDATGKSNFLKYAYGPALENIAHTRYSLTKNEAKYAKVCVRFELSMSLEHDLIIPANTRVSAGDKVFFTINNPVTIPAREMTKDIVFTCTELGNIGNNYKIGEINQLVDPIPYIQKISNIEMSEGGADPEDDDTLTLRTWEAPEGYAVAGPSQAYEYRAREYSQLIEDVVAYSPEDELNISYTYTSDDTEIEEEANTDISLGTVRGNNIDGINTFINLSNYELDIKFNTPVSRFKIAYPHGCVVKVVPLLKNATLPNQTFLNELCEYLSEKKYRPLTDKVITESPQTVNFDVDIEYWISQEDSVNAAAIQQEVEKAIEDYINWQTSKLSRDVNPDELIARIKKAGAKRLIVNSPTFTQINKNEIALLANKSVSYKGLEDE